MPYLYLQQWILFVILDFNDKIKIGWYVNLYPIFEKKKSCDENTIKTTYEYHILILVENKNWSIHKLPFIKNEVK